MRIWVGGFLATDYSLTFDGNRLIYAVSEAFGPPTEHLISDTIEGWDAFRSELDAIGIWDWHTGYVNEDICDGTQWEVRIIWGGRRCRVWGSNEYPNAGGMPSRTSEPTAAFSRFLHAVSRLAGGKPFQ